MAQGSRTRRTGLSPVAVGLIALGVLVVLVYLGFTKDLPFSRGFQVNAVFESSNSIRTNSPVRIAGVNVGTVTGVEAQEGSDLTIVTMELKDEGLPIHKDATAKIRPRIFLEGNYFVDLRPGTPESPKLGDGDTIKVTQTASPVQLDEVLTALQQDSREDLKDILDGLGTALRGRPTAEQDAQADPSTRGETGAKAFNDAYDDIPGAFRTSAIVNEALLGVEPRRDLRRLLVGTARTADGLARNEEQLSDLVSSLDQAMGAFASEQTNLSASIGELPSTLETANAALDELNAAFPSTRAFAREILPGVQETAATIDATLPWIAQATALVGQDELGGLASLLERTAPDVAALVDSSTKLVPQTDLAAKCATRVLLPTGNVVIQDEFPTGEENYKDAFYAFVGLSGEGQNFDGNGQYVRFQTGGGSQTIAPGNPQSPEGALFGNAAAPVVGTRPAYPGRKPPYVNDKPCYQQTPPDLNGPAGARGPSDTVIANDVPPTVPPLPGATAASRSRP